MASRALLLLAFFPLSVAAAEAPADAGEGDTPSMALLEFLGAWETQDGDWLDPLQILDEMESRPQSAQTEEQSDD